MRPRDVLAENLKKLMAGKPELKTFPLITAAGGGSNGTLDRIRRKTTATSIDNLEPLARAFGLEPWQLLVASLSVEDGAVVGLPGWPLTMVDQARWNALTEPQQGFVQARMLDAMKECEANKQAKQVLRKMGAKKEPASDKTVEESIPATKEFLSDVTKRKRGESSVPHPSEAVAATGKGPTLAVSNAPDGRRLGSASSTHKPTQRKGDARRDRRS